MDADMLTKPLGDAAFAKHRRSVMNLLGSARGAERALGF